MIRFAELKDVPSLKSLWRECFFEDGDFFFERMFSDCLVYDDGGVCAMLHILKYKCGDRCVFYLYGIGTTEKMRGKGIAARLIERAIELAKEEKCAFLMLVPQEESLFDYYARFGFLKLCLRALPKPFSHNLKRACHADIEKLNALYEEKYAASLHLLRSTREWEIILDEGYDVFLAENKYLISASGKILETNIPCDYELPTSYAAYLLLEDLSFKNAYFNILHD